jgi:hypothetical protein
MVLHRLAATERHIEQGERHIVRQREVVETLERDGRGQSDTAKVAREVLHSYELSQAAHAKERDFLLKALIEAPASKE